MERYVLGLEIVLDIGPSSPTIKVIANIKMQYCEYMRSLMPALKEGSLTYNMIGAFETLCYCCPTDIQFLHSTVLTEPRFFSRYSCTSHT